MGFAAELTAALALVVVVYWWFKHVIGVRNKLKWCKKKEGLPIVGTAFDFSGGSTGELFVNKIKFGILFFTTILTFLKTLKITYF